jgi:hypothetical protein
MKTNKLFGMITLIVGVMLVFTLIGCGDDGDPTSPPGGNGNGNGNGDNFTPGWPSASILSEFGISGLTAPAGATDIEYNRSAIPYDEGTVYGLGINFKSYATSDNPFHSRLITNGWTFDDGSSWEDDGSGSYWVYYKGNDMATYGWGSNSGSSISVVKNYQLLGI